MLTKCITRNGREYYCAAEACRMAYVTYSTLQRHADRGLPHIVVLGRRWYNVGDIMEYFAGFQKKQVPRATYRQDNVIIGGRVYHPFRWYRERYYVWNYRLVSLPVVERGRMKYVAEEDFMRKFGGKDRRR